MLETSLKFHKFQKVDTNSLTSKKELDQTSNFFILAKTMHKFWILNGVLNLVQLGTIFLKSLFAKIPSKLVENFNKIDNSALKEMD